MVARTADEVSGYEYDWLACDEQGRVAMFSTAGGGYAPSAFLADTDEFDTALDQLKSEDATTSASLWPTVAEGLPNPWMHLAQRGIYSYDSDPCGGPYQLVGAPVRAVHVDELRPVVANIVRRIVLRGVRLGLDSDIPREAIIASVSE